MMAIESAICVEALTCGPKNWKLQGMSCQLPRNQLSMILGKNGSGKTIFLKSLLGEYASDAGRIEFYRPRSQLTISWLPASQPLPFNFWVVELVEMGRFPTHRGFPSRSDRIAALESLSQLGIRHLANRRYQSLSQGERIKCQIARCLAQEPDILMMDEPCANLDIGSKIDVLQHLHRLCKQGKTVLMSHHDLHTIIGYSDHCLLLKQGKLIASGGTDTVMTPPLIEQAFGVEVQVIRHQKPGLPLLHFSKVKSHV